MQEFKHAQARHLLRSMFQAAVDAAQPALCLPKHLPPPPAGRTLVVGAGKASAAMASALEMHWQGPLEGIVITRYGHATPCSRIEIIEAAHPVPDSAGLAAAQRVFELVQGLTEDDLVICLISGGGSALLTLPAPGISLEDKQALSKVLLVSGASIAEINCVRRHLSAIKGGRLAAACHPARVATLVISDVPGDDPLDVASGPTVADPTTCADALAIATKYRIPLPPNVDRVLRSGGESVKPGDPRLARNTITIIANPRIALEAAMQVARTSGMQAYLLSDAIEGESRDVAKVLAGIAHFCADHGQPFRPPCLLLSGGETTVTVRGSGQGGRNTEFLLSLAIALQGRDGIYALAADTDGVDGNGDIAGAFITPDTLIRAYRKGMLPQNSLAENDGHSFFEALGDALVTGPTLTNINDFRAILVSE
ncbi:glycerate kinase [Arthrobacter sp. NPDC080086]|uniref:glycerate kinase type-2 family protein n=1 Tax=Arthrobacter sp. NPDC080086 TaxID=3155917 RepID=UPI00344D8853